jgi:hypothetical protein
MSTNWGSVTDKILHDVLIMGALAAQVFVKNPAHQQTAGNLINAVNELLQVVSPQLENVGANTVQTTQITASSLNTIITK